MSRLINYRCLYYSSLVIIMLIIVSAMCYGYTTHSSIIRADQWRFLELYIIPIHKGTFEISSLWSDHHPQPLTGLLFIISERIYDLTINLFFYVGMLGKVLFSLLFILLYNRTIKQEVLLKIVVSILIISTLFSMKSTNEYTWPLVLLSNFWIFIFLVFLFYFDKVLLNNFSGDYVIMFIVLFLMLLFVYDSALIYLASASCVTLLLAISGDKSKAINFSILFIVCFAITKTILFTLSTEQLYENQNLFNIENFNILGAMNSYAIALLSGVVKIEYLRKSGIPDLLISMLGHFVVIIYSSTIVLLIKLKLYKKTVIPITLMISTLMFITALLLYRFYPDNGNINWLVSSPRYIKMYEIGVIAMFWGVMLIFTSYSKNVYAKKITFIVSLILIFVNLSTIYNSWKSSIYTINSFKKAEASLIAYEKDKETIPFYIRGNYFSDDKVRFLKDNRLNVFSPNY